MAYKNDKPGQELFTWINKTEKAFSLQGCAELLYATIIYVDPGDLTDPDLHQFILISLELLTLIAFSFTDYINYYMNQMTKSDKGHKHKSKA